MGVFRRVRVFRDSLATRIFGSQSIITATTVAATIAFAGTAAGSTPGSSAEASGAIEVSGAPISEIYLEVSAPGAVVLSGSASGVQRSMGSALGTIAFAGTARCDALASGAISFAGTATVGSIFTMDAAGAIVISGTATSPERLGEASGAVVFAGTAGSGEISGGTVEAEALPGAVVFAGTVTGAQSNLVVGAVVFAGTATGVRFTNYRTPYSRICVIRKERRRI
jgi:hypothetical protein